MGQLNVGRGVVVVALFAIGAMGLSASAWMQQIGISPLIIGILLGMLYANTLRAYVPSSWHRGIPFCTKQLLRLGIVLYGFRVTFQTIFDRGLAGVFTSLAVVLSTFFLGYIVGVKWLKLDKQTTLLTSMGSSICGAAAVLATEPLLKSEAHKSAVAISTVVVFGTLSMFLYPALYSTGWIALSPEAMGMYIGGTLHEVAHVVAAGNALGETSAQSAIIVKMVRVMLLAPFLVVLGVTMRGNLKRDTQEHPPKILLPWFAFFFIAVAGFNSLDLLHVKVVSAIHTLDTFLLTMAMCALGMETRLATLRDVGMKPIYLAAILWVWLIVGGYGIVKCSLWL